MPHLIKIGNSQGIRIPKALIKQAGLEGIELEFILVDDGLLIKPLGYPVRHSWEKRIHAAIQADDVAEDSEWINAQLTDDNEWEWEQRNDD
jgi:antitoxin MazE